jgi:hypothetical protein
VVFDVCNYIKFFQSSVRVPATVTTCEKNAMGINYFHPNQAERFIAAVRVASLGGSLTIESGDTGACLEIALPIMEKRG